MKHVRDPKPRVLGTVRASASETIGSPVVAVGMGPRRWDPDRAMREAVDKAREEHPEAEVEGSVLVCYSYPKIAVRVDLKEGRCRTPRWNDEVRHEGPT